MRIHCHLVPDTQIVENDTEHLGLLCLALCCRHRAGIRWIRRIGVDQTEQLDLFPIRSQLPRHGERHQTADGPSEEPVRAFGLDTADFIDVVGRFRFYIRMLDSMAWIIWSVQPVNRAARAIRPVRWKVQLFDS